MTSREPRLCLIIGDPIAHSLSPAIHNAGYRELGIEDRFRYEARRVTSEGLADFMGEVLSAGIRGVSCTAPHKVAVMGYLDEIDPTAAKIGAVNTVVNTGGRLKGYNTDWLGVIGPLEKITGLKGKKVALLGAGGAARSIAYGLADRGADITIYNRTPGKAEALARAFGGAAVSLDDPARAASVKEADIIINATSVGMGSDDASPITKELMGPGQIIFDSIYTPYDTRLLKDAAEQGATVIHGTEMLLGQAFVQFELYTGYEAPEEAMRHALQEAL